MATRCCLLPRSRRSALSGTVRALALALQADLREAIAAWRGAHAAARATAQSAEASGAALEATLALYRSGRAGALDVLSAELDLARAEAGRTQALADIAVARALVERLAGP